MNTKILFGIAVITVLVFVLFAVPMLTITALNILFPVLAIPYTVWTWFAVTWLQFITIGAIAGASRNKK